MAKMTPEEVIAKTIAAVDKGFEDFKNDSSTLGEFGRKEIAANIIKRSRLGFGVRLASKEQYKFPPLASSYIEQRKGLLKFITVDGRVIPIKGFTELTTKSLKAKYGAAKAGGARKKKSLLSKLKGLFKKRAKSAVKRTNKKPRKDAATDLSPQTSAAKSNITATGLLLDKAISATARAKQIIVFIKNIKYTKNIFGERIKNAPTTIDVAEYLQDNLDREFLQTSNAEDNRLSRVMSKQIIKSIEGELNKIKT